MKKYKVKFEKFVDPLNSNVDEVEWPGFNLTADGEEVPIHAAKMQQVLSTPFGVLSMMSNTMACEQFDFWWMHTNFDISPAIRDIIKQVPGIETLEVQTRYRARIGIPKSGFFKSPDVMAEIQNILTQKRRTTQNELLSGLPNDIVSTVIDMRDKIDDVHDNWGILVLPNGHIETIITDKNDNEFRSKIQILISTQSLVGGRLITSEE